MNTNSGTLTDRLLERQVAFIAVFFIVFLASYFVLVLIDFVPEPISEETKEEFKNTPYSEVRQAAAVGVSADNTVTATSETSLPTQIYIKKLDRTIEVLNPLSRDVEDLDAALLEGVVRHPDSAKLGQEGNVFILGHSSYLPTVFNRNFQAFNGIQELEWGDEIEVIGENAVYVYRIDKVYRADAKELIVPIAGDEFKLTLATCDSFGSVEDRFIVEATQVQVKEL